MSKRNYYYCCLCVTLIAFAALSIAGITWGLPGRGIDAYLFGDDEPWPGEKIYRLAGADQKFAPNRGADVDVDPVARQGGESYALTGSEADVARILLRYRLYTHQPDEMITMMALAGMNPRSLDLDPRLYQYGGLFIYPVGALIKLCGVIGLIDVRGDVVYYLDHPEEFAKFYVVARAYAAAWGLVGVIVVFAIARRLGGSGAGLLAAILFTLLPVVVCMSHEGKPHLPGAVLMLIAVWCAMRCVDSRAAGFSLRDDSTGDNVSGGERSRGLKPAAQETQFKREQRRRFCWMCIACGAALGMVLSSWPIFVLIPLTACWMARGDSDDDVGKDARCARTFIRRSALGVVVGVGVYLVTNPYIVINALTNREVLRSNFGNSLAMYQIVRLVEGFTRVIGLTIEGATLPVLLLGVIALVVVNVRRDRASAPLAIAAGVFFLQFVLIGAGKPAEYGRFGIFTNTALAIGSACLLTSKRVGGNTILRWALPVVVCLWVGAHGAAYLDNFLIDTTENNSRTHAARWINESQQAGAGPVVAVVADPAPYGCPPLPFASQRVVLLPRSFAEATALPSYILVHPVDRFGQASDEEIIGSPTENTRWPGWRRETPISWANKPFAVKSPRASALTAP